MTTTTAIAQLDALDQTIAFVDGVFQPILDANNGVCPAAMETPYFDSLEAMRTEACNAKHELMANLDAATKIAISRIHADRQGR